MPASGTTLVPGGAAVTQVIKVENSAQGTKPREYGGCGAVRVRARTLARALAQRPAPAPCVLLYHQPAGVVHATNSLVTTRFRFSPPSGPAVALKLKLLYTPEGAEQLTEVTDVRNFPATL